MALGEAPALHTLMIDSFVSFFTLSWRDLPEDEAFSRKGRGEGGGPLGSDANQFTRLWNALLAGTCFSLQFRRWPLYVDFLGFQSPLYS